MDLFSNSFTPDTVIGVFIIKFGLLVSLVIFIPFLSILLGSLFFSLLHFNKGNIYCESKFILFAKYTSELILKKLWITIIIGILPFIGIVFFYSQIFSNVNYSKNLFFSFLFYIAGLILSLTFKRSFNLVKLNDGEKEVNYFLKKTNKNILYLVGWLGLVLILISSFLTVGYIGYTLDYKNQLNLSEILFSNLNIINYMLFLLISLTATSALVIVRLNRNKAKYNFSKYAVEFSAKSGIMFSIILPLLFVLIVFSIRQNVISFAYFFSSVLILLLMLYISVQFYLKLKGSNPKSTQIVLVIILLIVFLIYNGQLNSEKLNQKNDIKSGKLIDIYS